MKLQLHNIKNVIKEIEVETDKVSFDDVRELARKEFDYPAGSSILLILNGTVLCQTQELIGTLPNLDGQSKLVIMKRNTPKTVAKTSTADINEPLGNPAGPEAAPVHSEASDSGAQPTVIPPGDDSSSADIMELSTQLATIAGSDPNEMHDIISMVVERNPALAELIARDPLQFLAMAAFDSDMTYGYESNDASQNGASNMMNLQGDSATLQTDLSAADEDAICRLTELGFSRDVVIVAYLTCDKNEHYAANFLMDDGLN